MFSDFGIEKRLSESFQLRQRAFFVDPYQAARARDIRRQNSCQPPLYVLAAQDAPPSSGNFNGYIAELWTNVGLRPMSETGQKRLGRQASGCLLLPQHQTSGTPMVYFGTMSEALAHSSAAFVDGEAKGG